ncbi:MAG: hypothetical protein GY780_13575 [bacterium]|nr:hypothetical protein [bacterium]
MKSGNLVTHRSLLGLLAIFLLVFSGLSSFAETPDSTCANDTLFLVSPPSLHMEQQIEGRQGLVVSWEDLELSDATCYALSGHENLGYSVDVSGGFADQVDRQLRFETTDSGIIGEANSQSLTLSWTSEGPITYGVLSGIINLSNNGGVFQFDQATGTWGQLNENLPMSWRQTNTVALDHGTSGFAVAAFSGGQTNEASPQGAYKFDGAQWTRFADEIFTDSVNILWVSISPANNDYFAIGTTDSGLFVTTDGGENFVNWAANLDPTFEPAPTSVRIGAMEWSEDKIWAFVSNFGLFYSSDNGTTFQRSDLEVDVDLDFPEMGLTLPLLINEIHTNPSNPDHVLLAIESNGVFQSFDGGTTWSDTYGTLMIPDPDNHGAWLHSASSVRVDPSDENILIVGMKNKGLYRSVDGGMNWQLVGAGVSNPNPSQIRELSLLISDGADGNYYCMQDSWRVLVSSDQGINWSEVANQPLRNSGTRLVLIGDGSGDFLMSSYGGGIYIPDSPINLSDSYNSGTSLGLRDLDLGLDISFSTGSLVSGVQFSLICQTFQGWAVWRSPNHDPNNMSMIGLFDRVNPESCIEGYCGNINYELVPECYNSKRAACFDFDTPDTIRFFDEEVYNGFSYYYAISSYDYGNTALSSPQNSSQIAVFSPRFVNDPLTPFEGDGNRTNILLNDPAATAGSENEIYVYPNPLREESGLPGQEGETVVFTNLPIDSRIRIFTPAGDDVINLGPDNLHDGNIYWRTRNRENERVSAGVYLYKVEMTQRDDFWGRLVIIR